MKSMAGFDTSKSTNIHRIAAESERYSVECKLYHRLKALLNLLNTDLPTALVGSSFLVISPSSCPFTRAVARYQCQQSTFSIFMSAESIFFIDLD